MPFAHLTLATRDVERSLAFFKEVLGWRPINRPGNIGRKAAWLEIAPGQELHLLEVADFEPSPFEREFGRHVAFTMPRAEFDDLQRRLLAHGAELIEPERETPFDRFFFKDPNGYHFEIVDADRSPESCPGDSRLMGYQVQEGWTQLPPGWSWTEVAAVAADSKDRVFVFNRGAHPVMIFDSSGAFLSSWGEGLFKRPHGIFIGPDDAVYCSDDLDHTVRKFTPEGQLLLTLGTSGQPSDTGATSMDYRNIRQAAPPFHYPTNLALSPEGAMYVTDGYGNARVHKFAADGRLLFSWGEPGSGPGQFHLPHGIAVDRQGVVYVADRENSRLQLFNPDGAFLAEWTDVARPCQVFIDNIGDVFVAELGYRAGMFPGNTAPGPNPTGGRVSVFTSQGKLKACWGGGDNPCAPGDFFAPHGIWVDSRGDVYVGEVTMSAGGNRGLVPPDCHTLQKFVKQQVT